MKITATALVLAIVSLSTASLVAKESKKKPKSKTPSYHTMRGNGFHYQENLAVWRGPDCSVDMHWVDKSRIISVVKGGKCTVTGLQECTVIYK